MKVYKILVPFLVVLCLTALPLGELLAQCPMCRMTAESNLANGGSAGKGLNNGILYIFAFPYMLIGLIGFIWWRNNKKAQQLQADNAEE